MKAAITTKNVRVVSGKSSVDGVLRVVAFDRRAKLRRAMKTVGMGVVVSVGCACIPVAHFVLVPFALLITPVLAIRSFRLSSAIVGADVACAACGGQLTLLSSREHYPLFETCTKCLRENRIVLAQ